MVHAEKYSQRWCFLRAGKNYLWLIFSSVSLYNSSNSKRQCLWHCHHGTVTARVHLVHNNQAVADLWTKPVNLSLQIRLNWLHLTSPFITMQPKSWYLFYHSMKDRGLSQCGWLFSYLDVFAFSPLVDHPGVNCVWLHSLLIRHSVSTLCCIANLIV